MVEINNQRKAFLDMLAWSEGTRITDVRKPEIMVMDVIVGGVIYWLLRSPSQTCHAKTQTQINRRWTLPASFLLVGCLPQAVYLKDFPPKSQDAVEDCSRLRSVALNGDWSWWYPSGNRPLQQYLASPAGAGYGQVWSIRLTAWLQNSKKRVERSNTYEQSHRDYLRSGYLHYRLPVMGC